MLTIEPTLAPAVFFAKRGNAEQKGITESAHKPNADYVRKVDFQEHGLGPPVDVSSVLQGSDNFVRMRKR